MVHQVSQQSRLAHICKALSDFRSRRAEADRNDNDSVHSTLDVLSRTTRSFWDLRDKWRHSLFFHLAFELVYISALVTFVVGSVCFLPEFEEWVALGCDLFFVGSVVLAVLVGYEALEELLCMCGLGVGVADLPHEGETHEAFSCCGASSKQWEMLLEKMMYCVGSIVFAVGSAFWKHPNMVEDEIAGDQSKMEVFVWATEMFIGGSAVFAFAAFVNAMSLHQTHPTFTGWAMATCSSYELGGILFVMGSVCFLPNMGCEDNMLALGAWCFIVGSLMYVLGAVIGLLRTWALFRLEQDAGDEVLMHRTSTASVERTPSSSYSHGPAGADMSRQSSDQPHVGEISHHQDGRHAFLTRSSSMIGAKGVGQPPPRHGAMLRTLIRQNSPGGGHAAMLRTRDPQNSPGEGGRHLDD